MTEGRVTVISFEHSPGWYLRGDYVCVSIWELSEPGKWVLNSEAARYNDHVFDAKPHDADDARRVAVSIVAARLTWIMQMQVRELELMKKVIEKDTEPVKQQD